MTYTVQRQRQARVTTYPGRGPDGSDRRYIVGPVAEARALLETLLAGNPGSALTWEQVDHRLDTARFEVVIPQESK